MPHPVSRDRQVKEAGNNTLHGKSHAEAGVASPHGRKPSSRKSIFLVHISHPPSPCRGNIVRFSPHFLQDHGTSHASRARDIPLGQPKMSLHVRRRGHGQHAIRARFRCARRLAGDAGLFGRIWAPQSKVGGRVWHRCKTLLSPTGHGETL